MNMDREEPKKQLDRGDAILAMARSGADRRKILIVPDTSPAHEHFVSESGPVLLPSENPQARADLKRCRITMFLTRDRHFLLAGECEHHIFLYEAKVR